MAYYKIIGGVRYDRTLLEAADAHTRGPGEFQISLEEIQELYRQAAADGRSMTRVEKNTLEYIALHYRLTAKARRWLLEQLGTTGNDEVQTTLQRVLYQQYGLPKLGLAIESATVQQYLDAGGSRNWETVVRGAVEAFLQGSQGQLSFAACVARRDGKYNGGATTIPLLKSYLERGTLYLIPPAATPGTPLPYDLPHVLDAANFWTFVLQTPDFEPVEFFAFVHREQPFQYSRGQFSKKAALESTVRAAVRQFARFDHMEWNIPADELQRQLALLPGQNFGNALFSAVNTGIFNQESSTSFGDYIRQEIWPDPDTNVSESMHAYANTGTLPST